MIASLDPTNGPARWNDDSLARTLRLDLEDEERRALLGSYAISTALGIAFLLLQQFGPRVERVPVDVRPESGPIIFDPTVYQEPSVIQSIRNSFSGRSGASRSNAVVRLSAGRAAAGASNEDAIGGAFGGARSGGVTGDTRGLLRGVAVASGAGDAGAGTDAKQVLGYGHGGTGSALPGGAGLGAGSTGSAGIGGVGTAGGVGRAEVRVALPEVAPLDDRATTRETAALGNLVREREAQLQFCYRESLRANAALAGSVTVAVTIAGSGAVSNAEVLRRTWAGQGAAEAETCMLRAIRGWRFAAAERGGETYAFRFSFTR